MICLWVGKITLHAFQSKDFGTPVVATIPPPRELWFSTASTPRPTDPPSSSQRSPPPVTEGFLFFCELSGVRSLQDPPKVPPPFPPSVRSLYPSTHKIPEIPPSAASPSLPRFGQRFRLAIVVSFQYLFVGSLYSDRTVITFFSGNHLDSYMPFI